MNKSLNAITICLETGSLDPWIGSRVWILDPDPFNNSEYKSEAQEVEVANLHANPDTFATASFHHDLLLLLPTPSAFRTNPTKGPPTASAISTGCRKYLAAV